LGGEQWVCTGLGESFWDSRLLSRQPVCASHRIAIAEKFGHPKREQLVDKVQDARDGQVAAKQQFESALKQFLAITNITDPELRDLEDRYDKLKDEYERSESRAEEVHDRNCQGAAGRRRAF